MPTQPKVDVFEQLGQAWIQSNGPALDANGKPIPAAAIGLRVVQQHPEVVTGHPAVVAAINQMPADQQAKVHNVLKASMILKRDSGGLAQQFAQTDLGGLVAGGQDAIQNAAAHPGRLLAGAGALGAVNAAQLIPGSQPVTVPLAQGVNLLAALAAAAHGGASAGGAAYDLAHGKPYEAGQQAGNVPMDFLTAVLGARGAETSQPGAAGVVGKVQAAMRGLPQKAKEALPEELQGARTKLFSRGGTPNPAPPTPAAAPTAATTPNPNFVVDAQGNAVPINRGGALVPYRGRVYDPGYPQLPAATPSAQPQVANPVLINHYQPQPQGPPVQEVNLPPQAYNGQRGAPKLWQSQGDTGAPYGYGSIMDYLQDMFNRSQR